VSVRDELIRAAAPLVDEAEQRLRAGGSVEVQSVAHVDGEHDPSVGRTGSRVEANSLRGRRGFGRLRWTAS